MADKTEARIALEARAEAVDLKFPPNIGDEKLQQKVEAAEAKAGQKTPPAATVKPADGDEGIIVTGPKKGRWRAGRHFTREPVIIPFDDLTEADLDALEADPALTVEHWVAEVTD